MGLFPGIVPDTTGVNHCLIAALVAVGCGADCMQPYATFVLGITVTPIFIGASMLLKMLQVDDVCEGISMHYFAGAGACCSWASSAIPTCPPGPTTSMAGGMVTTAPSLAGKLPPS